MKKLLILLIVLCLFVCTSCPALDPEDVRASGVTETSSDQTPTYVVYMVDGTKRTFSAYRLNFDSGQNSLTISDGWKVLFICPLTQINYVEEQK